jgi:carbon storage regulator
MPKPSGNQIGRIVIEYAAGSVQSRTEDLEVFELAKDEMLVVGDVVRVVVVEIRGDRCKLGIEGDPECFVHRGEILAALQKDRRSEELDKGSAIDS